MKALFLIVCLVNLVFFFWEYHTGALLPPPPAAVQNVLPTIMRKDEVERARRAAILSEFLDKDLNVYRQLLLEQNKIKPFVYRISIPPKQALAEIKPLGCYELGPFKTRKVLDAWFQTQTFTGEVFDKQTVIASSYVVYYPFDKDPQQNRIHKMLLAAKGYNDFRLIPDGELKGAPALGEFKDLLSAENLKKHLAHLSIPAEIKPQMETKTQLFFRVKTEQALRDQVKGIPVRGCE